MATKNTVDIKIDFFFLTEPKVPSNFKKAQIGVKPKKITPQYKLPLQKQGSDEAINIMFDKCRLSLKNKPICEDTMNNNDSSDLDNISTASSIDLNIQDNVFTEESIVVNTDDKIDSRKNSADVTPDLVRSNYMEDEVENHSVKIGELQLKQKIMEEQNKKRKEMLAKALADR